MKKLLLIAFTLLLCFSIISIQAADEKGFLTVSGTTQTKTGNLAIIKVSASSQLPTNSITGTLSYDSNSLTIFKVIKSDNLGGWTFNIDTSTLGTIKYSGTYSKGGDGPIENDRTLFVVQFIVIGDSNQSLTLSSQASGKAKKTEVTVRKGDVLNQKEIDEAKLHNENLSEDEEPVMIPEPIIAQQDETKEVDVDIPFDKSNMTINISNPKSSDAYLKSLSVEDATLSPSFSKLSNAYKVIIDAEKEVKINYEKEDDRSTVVIQQEVNNQIIMTVTAEDGSTNAYVLTIVRQKNYDASNPNAPTTDNTTQTPVSTTPGTLGINKDMMVMLTGGGVISVIGILIGSILVITGKRGM